MINENSVHLSYGRVQEINSKVTLSWESNGSIESDVISCHRLGMGVLLSPLAQSATLPVNGESLRVHLPVDDIWLSGKCVYVNNDPDGSVIMGLYFSHPDDQNYLNVMRS
jgi:hypothetical protein